MIADITEYTGTTPVTYVTVMDATGSIVELLDTNGNVAADFRYDAWGERPANDLAAGACPFGFAGMFQDVTTGLYYDNARWYSASQGRFLTRDPSGESGGLNLYAYCGNDPVNQVDPTGLDSEGPWSLTLSGNGPGTYVPPIGGAFDLSPPAPDPYASLVGPQNSSWWETRTSYLSNQQILAVDLAHGIEVFGRAAAAKGAESRALYSAYQSVLLDAGVDPYGPGAYQAKAKDLLERYNRALAAQSSLSRVANALLLKFGELGLGDTQFGTQTFLTHDDMWSHTFGSGLDGATDVSHALLRRGLPSAGTDFGIFEAGIALATWGESSAITRLLSASLPEVAAVDVEVATVDEVAVNLGNLGCFRPETVVACRHGSRRIETVVIGRRVCTPDDERPGRTFDPAAHRVVHLQFVKDGQELLMSFLRPAKLIGNLGPGDTVRLSVFELQIEGSARVVGLDPCPAIEDGPGQVVIGTFRSRTVDLLRVRIAGSSKQLETTGNHWIFSEDENKFVAASSLRQGAVLRTRIGVAIVESIEKVLGSYEVFNLEIDGAHKYFVTECEVLVHNAGPNGIINGSFTPNAARVLQNVTNRVNEAFAANLSNATSVLSSNELLAAGEYPGLAKAAYGNAIERLVARELESDPILDGLFRHVGGPNKHDFVGTGIFKGMNFDITTPAQTAIHLARPGYGSGLNIITYSRPTGFP